MRAIWIAVLVTGLTVAASALQLQRSPEEVEASFERHRSDFDYLLGDWEFTADNKEWGPGRGYWSAVRLATGEGSHILDEYRIVGDDGETIYVTATLRAYNAHRDLWELVSVDDGGGLRDTGTARKVGDEMHVDQTFGVARGQRARFRIRYYDIRSDRFSWVADRSLDDGTTWEKDHLAIEARRIGPPRTLPPLAPARKPGA